LEPRTLLAVITPFAPRFSVNDTGDIAIIANTLMTAPDSDANAANARAGTGTVLNDNNFAMVYVDVDSDAATFNSSRATLDIPAGAQVLAAYLYWGGRTTAAGRGNVKFQAPGAAGYTDLTGTVLGSNAAGDYHAFFDVTATVQAAGEGQYAAANVQATTGTDRYAGWSLVVAYRDPASIPRNLTIFDGFAVVDATTPNVSITVNGFTTPPSGSVNANVGVIAYDGDLGSTGDSLSLNATTMTDARNPSNNFFNSTISTNGTLFTNKTPNYVNQLGFDADVVVADGILANSATSATINLTTGGEFYSPGVVTTSIELYAPDFTVNKTVVDLNGGDVLPGDVLEYSVAVTNNGGDASGQTVLTDPLPGFTNFVPGSLQILSGANAGTKTDALGDDQAEFDAANGRMVFRLGTGANGTTGGSFAVTESSTIRFRVTIDPSTQHNATVTSQATMNFIGVTLGGSLTRVSNQTSTPISPANDPPVNTVPAAPQSTAEDTPLVFSSAGGNAISVGDVDVNASGTGTLRVTLNSTNGTLTLSGTAGLTFSLGDGTADGSMTFDGTLAAVNAALAGLRFDPTPNFNGSGSIGIITSDQGNTGTGGPQSDSDTFAVGVTPVNDPPVADDDAASTPEDTPVLVSVLPGDTDVDGDPLTISIVSVTNGTATVDDNGTPADPSDDRIAFTPAANFNGAATITYAVSDGAGGTATAVATVTVASVPDAPVTADDAAVTPQDAAVTVDPLANDTDADGDLRPDLTTILTPPAHGTATVDPATGRITYTPAPGYTGPDQLVYQARDNTGLTATGTFSFTVAAAGQLTAAASDINATAGTAYSGTVGTFVFVGGPAAASAYFATIDWGDGASGPTVITADGSGGFSIAASHTYLTAGNYPLSLTVNTSGVLPASASATAHVAAAPVVVPTGGAATVQEAIVTKGARKSRNWSVSGTLDAPAVADTAMLIQWGDGTTTRVVVPAGATTFSAKHRFIHNRTRGPVTVTVLDGAGDPVGSFPGLTRNELWVIDTYRRVTGRDVDDATLAKLSDKLDRCRDASATRHAIERKLTRSVTSPAQWGRELNHV
jgi:uncharacterized repeat protein (TIGR01451 family)